MPRAAIRPAAVSPVISAAVEVAAGTITFATTNEGGEAHELAVLPGGGEVPFIEPGVPDEDAARLGQGATEVGEAVGARGHGLDIQRQ